MMKCLGIQHIKHKQLSTIFLLFVLMLASCSFPFSFNKSSTVNQVLNGDFCAQACWQFLTPGVSTRQDVEILLRNADIVPYSIYRQEDGLPMTYSWDYVPIESIPSELDQLRNGTVVVSTDGTVLRIFIVTQLCLSTVIEAYGIPDQILQSSSANIDLIYIQNNLIFSLNNDQVYYVALAYEDEYPDGNNVTLDELLSLYLEPNCTDIFNN